MSYIYWTADLHLSAKNTIEYCNRPYKSINHMNEGLIKNINDRVEPEDTLIHVGDFFMLQNEVKHKPSYYESLINCNIVHIMGNHDWNNSVKGCIESATVKICGKTAYVKHIPPTKEELNNLPKIVNLVICGHVHDKWKSIVELTDDMRFIPIINVGCDVWKYRPIRSDELIGYYNQLMREYKEKIDLNNKIIDDYRNGVIREDSIIEHHRLKGENE